MNEQDNKSLTDNSLSFAYLVHAGDNIVSKNQQIQEVSNLTPAEIELTKSYLNLNLLRKITQAAIICLILYFLVVIAGQIRTLTTAMPHKPQTTPEEQNTDWITNLGHDLARYPWRTSDGNWTCSTSTRTPAYWKQVCESNPAPAKSIIELGAISDMEKSLVELLSPIINFRENQPIEGKVSIKQTQLNKYELSIGWTTQQRLVRLLFVKCYIPLNDDTGYLVDLSHARLDTFLNPKFYLEELLLEKPLAYQFDDGNAITAELYQTTKTIQEVEVLLKGISHSTTADLAPGMMIRQVIIENKEVIIYGFNHDDHSETVLLAIIKDIVK